MWKTFFVCKRSWISVAFFPPKSHSHGGKLVLITANDKVDITAILEEDKDTFA